MVLALGEMIARLQTGTTENDTEPSEALWIKFNQQKTDKTIEYRTTDGDQIVHVYLGENGALVGIEIFP
jgi:uncharacterized protein YuzE